MSGIQLGSPAHEATCNYRASGGKEQALNKRLFEHFDVTDTTPLAVQLMALVSFDD